MYYYILFLFNQKYIHTWLTVKNDLVHCAGGWRRETLGTWKVWRWRLERAQWLDISSWSSCHLYNTGIIPFYYLYNKDILCDPFVICKVQVYFYLILLSPVQYRYISTWSFSHLYNTGIFPPDPSVTSDQYRYISTRPSYNLYNTGLFPSDPSVTCKIQLYLHMILL